MYGIRLPIDNYKYIWLSDIDETSKDKKPVLFKTEKEAWELADIWGPLAIVAKYDK